VEPLVGHGLDRRGRVPLDKVSLRAGRQLEAEVGETQRLGKLAPDQVAIAGACLLFGDSGGDDESVAAVDPHLARRCHAFAHRDQTQQALARRDDQKLRCGVSFVDLGRRHATRVTQQLPQGGVVVVGVEGREVLARR